MAATLDRAYRRPIHPLHAILLAFAFPLFLGALLSDWAYSATYQVQWTNFASWLIAGALAVSAFAVLWALIDLVRGAGGRMRLIVYFVVLLAMWVLGLVNALVHARDAWGAMPDGLILSAIVTLLALVASWIGYSGLGDGRVR